MNTRIITASDSGALPLAFETLKQGELVAFPTDTVYGLAARAFDSRGIERLYIVKQRSSSKAIAILLSNAAELPAVTASMNETARRLAEHFWPGPLTLVVPRHPDLPDNLSPLSTIGVRMPDHPVALSLIKLTGPLAVTSANLSGKKSTTTAQEVYEQLADRIPLILDGGRTPGGSPSTVVDCTGKRPVILRSGPISMEELLDVLS